MNSGLGTVNKVGQKQLWHEFFPMNFAKILRTPFFIEHLRWLPLLGQSLSVFLDDVLKMPAVVILANRDYHRQRHV